MTTATQAEPTGRVRLTVTINGTDYTCRPMPADGFGELKAFRLAKQSGRGEVYDVTYSIADGITCTCNDYTFRRAGLPGVEPCKHGRALRAAGLLD